MTLSHRTAHEQLKHRFTLWTRYWQQMLCLTLLIVKWNNCCLSLWSCEDKNTPMAVGSFQ
jgi:hypothetical protein